MTEQRNLLSTDLKWDAEVRPLDGAHGFKWTVDLRQGTRHLSEEGGAGSYDAARRAVKAAMRRFGVPRKIRRQV